MTADDRSREHEARAQQAGVCVRAARTDDLAAIATMLGEPGVVHGTLQTPWTSLEARADAHGATLRSRTDRLLIAELLDTGELAGSIGLYRESTPRRRHVAAVGMSVRDSLQGRGIGGALMASALHLADGWFQIRRVELEVYADNEPALALYRRFGFEVEGCLRSDAYRDGEYIDSVMMGRLRPDLR